MRWEGHRRRPVASGDASARRSGHPVSTARPSGAGAPLAALRRFGLPAALVPVVVACFWPVLSNGFVNWDDPSWFAHNTHYRGLSPAHLHWMFTTFHMSHYQPVTWLSHAVVYALCGEDPAAYHGASLLLHAANAVLLFYLIAALLRRAWPADPPGWRVAAAVGALVFAIHPLRVEAVAWAAARQEVLSAFFVLCTLLAYLRMAARQAQGQSSWAWYGLSVVCFALSLLSKAAGIMLPVALLVLDAFPLRRLAAGAARWRVLMEKLPFFLLALGAAILVAWSKRADTVTLAEHGVLARLAQALYGLCFYVWKTVAPGRLSPLYRLHTPLQPAAPEFLLSGLAVIAMTAVVIRVRRRHPWALAAWAWYAVIVFPVLGFGQAGPQLVADRYTYLACLPWAVLAAAGAHWAMRPGETGPHRVKQRVAAAALVVALSCLGVRTYTQSRVWKDSVSLWTQVIAVEPDSAIAYHNRGQALELNGEVRGALADYDAAVRLDPRDLNAVYNRAGARKALGDLDGALADYDRVLRRDRLHVRAYNNRGNLRAQRGDLAGALADFDQAIRLSPGTAKFYVNRGDVRQTMHDFGGAIADYTAAIGRSPTDVRAYERRAAAREALGDAQRARADRQRAMELAPDPPRRAPRGVTHR
jgi:tetratricopeptide (TPR) repeat protein